MLGMEYNNNMGHTYHQNIGHVVFHIKSVMLREKDWQQVWAYIAGVAIQCGIERPLVGGVEDHIHLLGRFPITQTVPDVMRRVKAISSRWIKGLHGQYADFAWQQGYGYFSVSPSRYASVAQYIGTQKDHHATMSTADEWERLLSKHMLFEKI